MFAGVSSRAGSHRPAVGQAHRVPVLGAADDLGLQARYRVDRAAKLAVDHAMRFEIHPLPDQRRAPAAAAALTAGVAPIHGSAHQSDLKL